jgi:thymidylate synthase
MQTNIDLRTSFENATHAFEYWLAILRNSGYKFQNTKALFNIGFWLENPMDNIVYHRERPWNQEYADAEWKWYLTGDNRLSTLGDIYGKIPKIWQRMADKDGRVNSNYGWQWNRSRQLDYVVNLFERDPQTRQAAISIYDGKENANYAFDTPCTYAIQFYITDDKLNMSVMMRSNDLWYGFAIDQYCFSNLQKTVAQRLSIEIGQYYHFTNNLHIYNDRF